MKIFRVRVLGDLLEAASLEAAYKNEEGECRSTHIINAQSENGDYYQSEFSNCIIEESRFIKGNFAKSSFVDVIFKKCDFSNCNFKDTYFQRCEFITCKCMGMNMNNASIKNTTFTECNLQYALFNETLLDCVMLDQCNMTEASMSETKHKQFVAEGTSFIGTNFFKTKLRGLDFTKNELLDITVSDNLEELKGIKVTPMQAVELVKLMGVIVI